MDGAKSRGPTTPEGKARAARNALKHGMRAPSFMVLPQEDAAAFRALEAALRMEGWNQFMKALGFGPEVQVGP